MFNGCISLRGRHRTAVRCRSPTSRAGRERRSNCCRGHDGTRGDHRRLVWRFRSADIADKVTEAFPGQAEPLVWEGIILSSLAGEKGGFGALSLARQGKLLFEAAIGIDGKVLAGSAYNRLGALYYKVPGWPLGFGDKAKASELLLKALAVNPNGIDPNYFYGEYLLESRHPQQVVVYLERALQAPPRPGHQVADIGRHEEARLLLEKARAK